MVAQEGLHARWSLTVAFLPGNDIEILATYGLIGPLPLQATTQLPNRSNVAGQWIGLPTNTA